MRKFLAEVIGLPVNNGGYSVKKRKEFITNIADMEIAPDEVMIRFDMEALYTSLLIDQVLKYT